MIILGIDPGSRVSGYSAIQINQKKVDLLETGVLNFHEDGDFPGRVKSIYSQAKNLFLKIRPDEISLESLIYVKSPTAIIKLAQSRGAILAAFFAAAETLDSIFDQDKIFEYSPNLIKSSVSGFGHADKLAMQKALNMILGKQSYITHDASDATAAAVCHYLHRNSLPVKMESHLIKQKSLYKKKRSLAQSLDHMLKEG